MDGLIPWDKLEQQLAKKYSKGKTGRKPYPLRVMLRAAAL
jgi:IS5 family transposase